MKTQVSGMYYHETHTVTINIFDILKLLIGLTIQDLDCKISLWRNIHPAIEPEPELTENEKRERVEHQKEMMKTILKDDIKKIIGIPKRIGRIAAISQKKMFEQKLKGRK